LHRTHFLFQLANAAIDALGLLAILLSAGRYRHAGHQDDGKKMKTHDFVPATQSCCSY
jgi:hypothetical protein